MRRAVVDRTTRRAHALDILLFSMIHRGELITRLGVPGIEHQGLAEVIVGSDGLASPDVQHAQPHHAVYLHILGTTSIFYGIRVYFIFGNILRYLDIIQ